MHTPIMQFDATPRHRSKFGLVAGALLITGAVADWGTSATTAKSVAEIEPAQSSSDTRNNGLLPESPKAGLVGSYVVTGNDPDGKPYSGAGVLDISLAPSGALELDWDNGRLVGVGQLIGNVLAVAYSIKGRTVISIMNVNPDGSLSGKWLRRTDRGSKGTETWTKT